MRKILLRTINEKRPDGTIFPFGYMEYFVIALRAGGQRGLTVADMRTHAPLIAKLEAVSSDERDALLEEAEYQVLLQAACNLRFQTFFHAAIQWLDELESAATVKVEEKNEG